MKKDGKSRVEVGPKTVLLGYDEDLTRLCLSTSKPKNTDKLFETVYLKIAGNQVSDIVTIETSDGVSVEIKLILQVKFEGDPASWFTVDNYVKQITDHVRSILRGVARTYSIDKFIQESTAIVRNSVLGAKDPEKGRPGCVFKQNSVKICDVDVLNVTVTNSSIAEQIRQSQTALVAGRYSVIRAEQEAKVIADTELTERIKLEEKQKTEEARHDAAVEALTRALERALAEVKNENEKKTASINATIEQSRLEATANDLRIEIKAKSAAAEAEIETKQDAIEADRIKVETAAIKERFAAISADFVAALQAGADRDAMVDVVSKMGLSAYVKNDSVGALLNNLLTGTKLSGVLTKLGTVDSRRERD